MAIQLTQKAQDAITEARAAALEMGHPYIGSEHLLVGLAREGSGVAAKVLADNGADADKIFETIKSLVGTSMPLDANTGIDLTPRGKRVIQMSALEAQQMGHNYVGTEHILLSIIRDGSSVAAKVLESIGTSAQAIYDGIIAAVRNDYSGAAAGAKSGSPSGGKTPTLDKYSRDLTAIAREGGCDPVIGRNDEINRVIQILARRTKNNPCLVGEPGVGKTAVAEGLAERIVDGAVPEPLKDKRLLALDLSSVVAGAKYRGEFEERMNAIINEVKQNSNVILFIDEIHTIVGTGSAEGAMDASNILKPSLARGELQLVGATTLKEYKKYIEKDAALERRFQPVNIGEPTEEETLEILKGIRDKYEAHHKVSITDKALEAAVKLSARYISDRFLPDKAIDLIDEASSKKSLDGQTAPNGIQGIEKRLKALAAEKEAAVTAQDFEKAAEIRKEEVELEAEYGEKKKTWEQAGTKDKAVVDEDDIAEILSEWTKIPVQRLTEGENEKLKNLENLLHERVIGQDEAVNAVARAIRRGRAGLKDPKRPIGSFLFLGPTGVGKTELSKTLAEVMFGSEDDMIRIDMSEYMEKHAVSKFVGSPPGYVGFEEGGQLTEKIRKKPYCVLLFDEIEKAHPDVFNIMLQILEDGILTDAQGRRVDFRNTVIIMTSNLGAKSILGKQGAKLGFGTGSEDSQKTERDSIRDKVMSEVKSTFKPEFLNRIDEVIVFDRLSTENIQSIATLMLGSLKKRLAENGITAEFSDAAVAKIANEGFDEVYGARPLRRAIQSKIEDMLSEKIIDGDIKAGDSVTVDERDGEFVVV